jgi:hypothetical protein
MSERTSSRLFGLTLSGIFFGMLALNALVRWAIAGHIRWTPNTPGSQTSRAGGFVCPKLFGARHPSSMDNLHFYGVFGGARLEAKQPIFPNP